jgi:hypothetical protein
VVVRLHPAEGVLQQIEATLERVYDEDQLRDFFMLALQAERVEEMLAAMIGVMTMSDYTVHDPKWETTEHGWHAVAALCSKGYQWTAYIEYADATQWRIWAGCMFESLQQAQAWCHAEIANQLQRGGGGGTDDMPHPGAAADAAVDEEQGQETSAWHWLWSTLRDELGETRMGEIRAELERRMPATGE